MSKERLTKRKKTNTAYYFPLCFEKCYGIGASRKCYRCELVDNACNKLGEYEDLEEQGLLLRLPVAVGGTVWVSDRDGKPREMILDEPDIRCHCAKEDNLCMALCDRKNTGVCAYRFKNDGSDIGERAFLTKTEAEEKLRELEGK